MTAAPQEALGRRKSSGTTAADVQLRAGMKPGGLLEHQGCLAAPPGVRPSTCSGRGGEGHPAAARRGGDEERTLPIVGYIGVSLVAGVSRKNN